FLSEYLCDYHDKLDVVFNFAGSSFTEENLAALIRQAAGLGDEVAIEIDNFDELLEDYGGCGDDSGDYGMIWPSVSTVTFTDAATGETVEEDIGFSIRKCLPSAELYPDGVIGVCNEDADADLLDALDKMNDIAYGEDENLFSGFNGEYTAAGVEAFFRELTGLTDADTYGFRLFGFDPAGFGQTFRAMFINMKAENGRFDAVWNEFAFEKPLQYNEPDLKDRYTEKEYPLVTGADVYVATDGSDSNPGTFDAPVATFGRAAELVREIKATKTEGDIIVAFKAGDYGPLSVTLTAEDSGTPEQKIVYCKYGDGDVTFSNGMDFEADSFESLTEDEKGLFNANYTDSIKKVDVSALYEMGLGDDDILVFYSRGLCNKARFPNKYEDDTDNLPECAVTYDDTSLSITLPLIHNRLKKYNERQFDTMEIWGHIIRGYRKDAFKVASYDVENRILHIANWETSEFGRMRPGWAGVTGDGIDMCVTNVPYELDHAGEYWIDPTTKTMYVFDPSGNYFVPGPGTMVTMDHTDDVTFRGLTFRNATGRFITATMSHGVTLDRCEFNGTSAVEGVYFSDNSMERPMELTVRECTFANAYGHALYVDGNNTGPDKFEKSTGVIFDNNLVKTTNILYDTWNGIHFYKCTDVEVTHNRFENCKRGAVSFTHSSDLLVEYNDFASAMVDSDDGGVIYTDWIADARDLVVRYNFFGHVTAPRAGAGQYGLYLDEFSSGFEIYSNLFYDTGNYAAMFSLGRDNVFRDNVLIFGAPCGWGTSSRVEIDDAGSPEAARAQGCWGIHYGERTWFEFFANCEDPEYRQVIEERWPDMLNIHFDYDNMDDPYFALNQVTYINGNVAVTDHTDYFRTSRKYEQIYAHFDNNTYVLPNENPLFADPTSGDYSILEGTDFPDIHFDEMGRY
ncbi:MAG: right-handed parallel beta-helix repeat-containing protein, partial [Clostridia bacterium]|nr:right-handed parallel beta-helix repeat-containing protein [Clostridia bacterium]